MKKIYYIGFSLTTLIACFNVLHTQFCINKETEQVDKNLFIVRPDKASTNHNNNFLLFSHGLSCYQGCVGGIMDGLGNKMPCYSFNYPDATEEGRTNLEFSSLAQTNEIAALSEAADRAWLHFDLTYSESDSTALLVGHGISRGASSWITTLAYLSQEQLNNIGAIILESPFDEVMTIVKHMSNMVCLPCFKRLGHKIITMSAKQYDPDGITPIKAIKKIKRKDIPILIVCSKEDVIVPWYSTARLYLRFLRTGHTHVYLLVLEKGDHALLYNNAEYRNVLHQFYKTYNITHDSSETVSNQTELMQLKPSANFVQQGLSDKKSITWKQRKHAFNFMLNFLYG